MKLSPPVLQWIAAFFLSLAFTLAVGRPEKAWTMVVFFTPAFWLLAGGVWLRARWRARRDRLALQRVWQRLEAEALSARTPRQGGPFPDRPPQPDRRHR